MCQGIILSLLKWEVNGRKKSIILTGVGSHSSLIQDNLDKLKKAGWKEGMNETVISVESDFIKQKWNKFTLEGGKPTDADLKRITREYKKIGGGPTALINHIKRCGKIDNSLLNLLTISAWAEYNKAPISALAEYEKAKDTALAECGKAEATALAEYEKARDSAWAEYEKARDSAWAECEKAKDTAFIKLFSKKQNRRF